MALRSLIIGLLSTAGLLVIVLLVVGIHFLTKLDADAEKMGYALYGHSLSEEISLKTMELEGAPAALMPGSIDDTMLLGFETSQARLIRFKESLIALSFIIVAFIASAAYVLMQRLFGPIDEVSKGIVKIKNGDYSWRLGVGANDEIGCLARRYNTMASSLEESVVHYKYMIETIPDAIIVIDSHGVVQYANRGALTATGYGKDELVDRPFSKLFPPEDSEAFEEFLSKILDGKPIENIDQQIVVKSGGCISLEINAVPVWQGGKVAYACCVARNTDERKRLTEEMETAKKKAEESAEKLEKTIRDLDDLTLLAVRREIRMQEIKKWHATFIDKEKPDLT